MGGSLKSPPTQMDAGYGHGNTPLGVSYPHLLLPLLLTFLKICFISFIKLNFQQNDKNGNLSSLGADTTLHWTTSENFNAPAAMSVKFPQFQFS